MADNECRDACNTAYKARIVKLFDTLADCLLTSDTDAERTACRERFRRGVLAARQAREIAMAECGD